LRLTVLDDMRLGFLMRRAGGRSRGFLGVDDVECHWGDTVGGMVQIMEKNAFAAVEFRTWLVVAGSLFAAAMLSVVIAGWVSLTVWGWVAGLSPFLVVLPAVILARRVGWPWFSALLVPFMFPVFLYSMLNSTIKTLRQGGVRWRETFYPLAVLRKGTVR